jgi:16S rRNA (guanine527-N7)-methyltransferase
MFDAASPLDGLQLPTGFAGLVGATPERLADVESFRRMLVETNATMNLVGDSTLAAFWLRHFVDSAQLLWIAPGARTWADLGAGAGLPGIVLAILLKGRGGAHVHLVESMAKRCAFLSRVVEAIDLPATVHNTRAETLGLDVEIVTARACAPLDKLINFAQPSLKRGATALFLKGSTVDAEIKEARRHWRFEADTRPSLSDPRGRVLALANARWIGGGR